MTVHWVTAFVDVAEEYADEATAFWRDVTGATLSARRGDREQWVTLIPDDGESALRMQRIEEGPRVHIDLHTDAPQAMRDRAMALGATVIEEPGHIIMGSPGGLVFCFVHGDGSERMGAPIDAAGPAHRVDQLSIDCPADAFDAELAFWAALTGWPPAPTMLPEFASLEQPGHIPFRFLFQRLGADDGRPSVHAHLDVSAGPHRRAVVDKHLAAGATLVDEFEHWTVLNDPAGLDYCITDRNPFAGAPLA